MKAFMSGGRRGDGWLLRLALYVVSGVLIAYVLWLIAGFDTLVGLATLGAFVLPMVLNYGKGTVFFAAIIGVMMLATLPNGYRHLRRQYDLAATGRGVAGRGRRTPLRYKGYSETHHQWMPLAGVPTSALVFVALLFVLVLLF